MDTPQLTRHNYTVGCICPMGVELAPVTAMLDDEHPNLPTSRYQNAYTFGRIGEHNVVVAAMPETGNNNAATVATQLQNDFPAIRFGLLVGVGGGVPGRGERDDIRLGDVVVSEPTGTFGGVVQFDRGDDIAKAGFKRTGTLNKPPPVLRNNIEALKARHDRVGTQIPQYISDMMRKYPRMQQKYARTDVYRDELFEAEYDHFIGDGCDGCDRSRLVWRDTRQDVDLVIHYGTIGSSNKRILNGIERDRLKQELGIICVEMEAAGLMDSFPCLVVRGICDYADSHTNKKWQPYAATVAAAYMKELLMLIPAEEVVLAPPVKSE
jgi:nucleoside phosphorylase